MQKAIFTNHFYFYGVIIFISILLLYNIYAIYLDFELKLVPAILIQIVLLILIFTKHKIIRLSLKIWSAIFLIGAFGLFILGGLLKDLADVFENFNFLNYLPKLIFLFLGILIYIGAQKTIVINQNVT